MKNRMASFLIAMAFVACVAPSKVHAVSPGLSVKSFKEGTIDHAVVIESPGQFRLVSEAAYNYGISKWFDLIHDRNGDNNLLHNSLLPPSSTSQDALFNQKISPDDLIAHISSAKDVLPAEERSLKIVEKSPVRVVIESSCYPMNSGNVNKKLKLTTRYIIYLTGKIFITNTMLSLTDQEVVDWRNSIIGLGDPTYITNSDSGSTIRIAGNVVRDDSKIWKQGQWAGHILNQSEYNSWDIIANSSNTLTLGKRLSGNLPVREQEYVIASRNDRFGWLRSTHLQDPYVWHAEQAKYLFVHWDPATPEPYSGWSRASILLVPDPANPFQGRQFFHEWSGFKRFYYVAQNIKLRKGESITQHYMMQLGTKGSSLLPGLDTRAAADVYADYYLSDHGAKVNKGRAVDGGFNNVEGCYTFESDNNSLSVTLDGSRIVVPKPFLKITSYRAKGITTIRVNGTVKKAGVDYLLHASNNTLSLQLLFDIDSVSTIEITESSPANSNHLVQELSVPDTEGVTFNGGGVVKTSLITKGTPHSEPPPAPKRKDLTSRNFTNDGGGLRKFAILSYSKNSPSVSEWIDQRFSYKISGSRPALKSNRWMTYIDIYGIGSLQNYLELKEFALVAGFAYEDMLLHARKNYTSTINTSFEEMDKFDVFEGKNGVLRTRDNIFFEDLTGQAYKGNVLLSGIVYIGYEEPFAEVRFQFAKPGEQVRYTLEFWNGKQWQSFPASDGTHGMTRNGTISFVPPAQWDTVSLNGSRRKYFVRFIIADAGAYPVTNKISGDDWLNGSGNACRGWDDTDQGILNSGPVPFNPNPPADASAKFRYQARISFWASNHFIAHPADIQTVAGKNYRTWSKFIAEQVLKRARESGYSGVMFDDGDGKVDAEGIPADKTDFIRKTKASWMNENIAKYEAAARYIKESNPDIAVGINSQRKHLVLKGDWNLAEYFTAVWESGNHGMMSREGSGDFMSYDDYLPQNNPKGIKGILISQDTIDLVPGTVINWDRGNRGPIAALSKHYIGMNENTVFSYYSRGGYIYNETDEVYLYNDVVLHQSVDTLPKVEQVVRWATYFPAMGVDIGVPDTRGHNSGGRDLQWKKGARIGGGTDIWRRDFTKAVILHRPAYYNTTKKQYEIFSSDIPLGATFYPLRADGLTGSPTSRISLRSGEGMILMKYPISE